MVWLSIIFVNLGISATEKISWRTKGLKQSKLGQNFIIGQENK